MVRPSRPPGLEGGIPPPLLNGLLDLGRRDVPVLPVAGKRGGGLAFAIAVSLAPSRPAHRPPRRIHRRVGLLARCRSPPSAAGQPDGAGNLSLQPPSGLVRDANARFLRPSLPIKRRQRHLSSVSFSPRLSSAGLGSTADDQGRAAPCAAARFSRGGSLAGGVCDAASCPPGPAPARASPVSPVGLRCRNTPSDFTPVVFLVTSSSPPLPYEEY